MIKQQNWYNVPFQDVLKKFGNSMVDKASKKYVTFFIEALQKKGINYITDKMSLFSILKEERRINNKEASDLIKTIFE